MSIALHDDTLAKLVFSSIDTTNIGKLTNHQVRIALRRLGKNPATFFLPTEDIDAEEFATLIRTGSIISIQPLESDGASISSSSCNRNESQANDTSLQPSRIPRSAISLSIFSSLFAGAIAGAIAKTIIAPLDRVKILFQVSKSRQFSLLEAGREASSIVHSQGWPALWRGNSATMLRVLPYAAIQFTSFEQLKHIWLSHSSQWNNELSIPARFCSGALAGTISVMCTYPFDLLRARLAVQQDPCRRIHNIFSLARQLHSSGGIPSLFRGLRVTIIGIVPYAGISFTTFETLKHSWMESRGCNELPTRHRLAFGATSGLIAQSVSYPLDIVRRRLQVGDVIRGHDGSIATNLSSALRIIVREEGIVRGLFKGLSMNFIKGPISVGVSFTVFDTLKTHILRQENN